MCCLVVGCSQKPTRPGSDDLDEFGRQIDVLYRRYLESDVPQARSALTDMIAFTNSSRINARARSHSLWLAYARLYALGIHSGNRSGTDEDLANAQAWYSRDLECRGLGAAERAVAIKAMTADKCIKIVEKWDADATHGRGPVYLRLIGKDPAENAKRDTPDTSPR
jgi:hypothetical protein